MTARPLRIGALALLAACAAEPAVTTLPPTTTSVVTSTTTTLPPATTTTIAVPTLDRDDPATVLRMRTDLEVLLSLGPRVSGSPQEAAAIEHFAESAAAITGGEVVLQPVPLPGGAMSANALVEVGGGGRVLLLGAHIDSVPGSPGADDNGSGVVLLLELLRRLHEDPPQGLRVMIVALGAEERIGSQGHHFGSRHAVAEMTGERLPDYMISVDMVGVGSELQVVDHRDSDHAFADELATVAAAAGFSVVRNSRGEVSDHVPFARAGVPAALLNRPDNPGWHTPGDDTVSDGALLVVLELLEAIVEYLDRPPGDPEGGAEHHV